MANSSKEKRRNRLRMSIRSKISGTAEKPRLSVFKSNKAVYAQLIDDVNGHTIAFASSKEQGVVGNAKIADSLEVGKKLAEKAIEKGISEVKFDRGGYIYHGKIKALADGAREGGLKF